MKRSPLDLRSPRSAAVLDPAEAGLPWLVRLRWLAAIGQGLALGFGVGWFGAEGAALSFAVPVIVAVSNLLVPWLEGRLGAKGVCGAFLCLDTALLAFLLARTGGPVNPFSALFLVQIVLSAVLLPPRWTWAIAGLSVASYGALFALPEAADSDPHAAHLGNAGPGHLGDHLAGMWWAFLVTAVLISVFASVLRFEIERRDREIGRLRADAERGRLLASVSTLAAGAAHELATPLEIVALSAAELRRATAGTPVADPVAQEVAAIEGELEYCREILDDMALGAGELPGEAPKLVDLRSAVEASIELVAVDPAFVRVGVCEGSVVAPPRSLVRALASVLRNAVDASSPGAPIDVAARASGSRVEVEIADRGEGLSPEAAARWGEPFFSTRGPRRGLGLFVVRALVEQLGGWMHLEPRDGGGTVARIQLPSGEVS